MRVTGKLVGIYANYLLSPRLEVCIDKRVHAFLKFERCKIDRQSLDFSGLIEDSEVKPCDGSCEHPQEFEITADSLVVDKLSDPR
jgi:hypothetical protein